MYPSDDGPIRARLLINECRELRRRLVERVAESRALQARAARLRARADARAGEESVPESWGARERWAEPATGLARVGPVPCATVTGPAA